MFNSRSRKYRDPVGAVAEGTPIHFRITLPRELSCSAAHLVIQREGSDTQVLDLFWCGMNGNNQEWWECHFTPGAPGLYFYHFEVRTHRGSQRLSKGFAGDGIFGGNNQWQLTVYDKAFQTPDWLEGGIMYQIFPDRFYKSGAAKGEIPTGRTFHENWQDQPDWAPNAQGKITNTDFFGGDLQGIREKLPYLKELGVTCLYMNPIFESHSNHRYDTADYSKIDPLLGDEEDFRALCQAAKELGIRVVIDGVFSHTGSDSVYFNREGRYPTPGAYNSQQSPYYPWYSFRQLARFLRLLVELRHPAQRPGDQPQLRRLHQWERGHRPQVAGGGGLRLAAGCGRRAARPLPGQPHARRPRPSALMPWCWGRCGRTPPTRRPTACRRRYLLGQQLDTVMNYPFRDAILGFLLGGDPRNFAETVESICENYPPQCLRLLMNHIGTHDTERVLTVLGGEPAGNRGREWQAAQHLSPEQWETGLKRLRLASLIQYLLPGVPCRLLRGRGRHGRLPGPLQPGLLSLGQRGSKPAHLVQGPGAAPRPGERHFRAGLVPHPVRQREPAGL